MCFQHCTDNFFSRSLSPDESNCVDKCVFKFSNVNQKIMSVYVETQTVIQQRRMAEVEAQLQAAQNAEIAKAQNAEIAAAASLSNSTTSVLPTVEAKSKTNSPLNSS